MEITKEQWDEVVESLKKVNNSVEDEIMAQADRLLALRLQVLEVERVLGEMATIAQQTAKLPS